MPPSSDVIDEGVMLKNSMTEGPPGAVQIAPMMRELK
jgi:hypothetical protein